MSKIVVLLGTTREGRMSERVATFVTAELKKLNKDTVLVDARDVLQEPPFDDTDLPVWMKIAAEADAFVIVAPEYNHGYPGTLKMILDGAYDEYEKKPVGLVGVSSGPFGGIRMIEQLLGVCHELGLVGIHEQMMFGNPAKTLSESGELLDPSIAPRMETFGKALIWWMESLKKMRG